MAGLESVSSTADNLALAPVEEQANSVQVWSFLILCKKLYLILNNFFIPIISNFRLLWPLTLWSSVLNYWKVQFLISGSYYFHFNFFLQPIGSIAERFHALCLKDSGILYEDPYIQVCSCLCSSNWYVSYLICTSPFLCFFIKFLSACRWFVNVYTDPDWDQSRVARPSWSSCSFSGKQKYFSPHFSSSFDIASLSFKDGALISTGHYSAKSTGNLSFLWLNDKSWIYYFAAS